MLHIPLHLIGALAGGLGLFMLGMQLMTEGLKMAAGNTLRAILKRSTSTPLRGLLSGAFITSLVQSSSAVTVATIGFVNAGLMDLGQALTVIYGSNIGTTMTGWLVALVGFQFDIKAFAMPTIGFGMFMRMVKGKSKAGALGESLAGFGIFFVGIDVLKDAFAGIGSGIQLASLGGGGFISLLVFLGIGFLLTLLMQSSSAAIAIALTATAGGLVPLNDAAAVVIGANIGTTSTAALAVIGATSNAKRAAAAHVIFNLFTGLVAILILPLLLNLLSLAGKTAHLTAGPVSILALFHTFFNILGVVLMLPLTHGLVQFLQKRFRTAEEDEAKPRYLDKNVTATPVLAIEALAKELCRIGVIARRMAQGAISSEEGPGGQLETDRQILLRLETKIGEFANLIRRNSLPPELDNLLPNALRVSGYYTEIAEVSRRIAKRQSSSRPVEYLPVAEEISHFKQNIIKFLQQADVEKDDFSLEETAQLRQTVEEEYKHLKAHLLRAGTRDEIPVGQVVHQLDIMSDIHRIADQAEKGARYLATLTATPDDEKNGPGANAGA